MRTFAASCFIALAFCATIGKAAVYNAPCKLTAECVNIYTSDYQCIDSHCKRKGLNYNPEELLGSIMIIFIAMVANAGGLGAGAVIIPVYMFMYGFVATDSIPLSKITIFAGAIVNIIFTWNHRHFADKNKHLINYNLGTIMIPLLLGGTMIGVMISKLLPGLIITIGLICYLALSIFKLYEKGMNAHKLELRDKLIQNNGTELQDSEKNHAKQTQRELVIESDRSQQNNQSLEEEDDRGDSLGDRQNSEEFDSSIVVMKLGIESSTQEDNLTTYGLAKQQFGNWGLMILAYIVILCTALIRGGEGKPSVIGMEECGTESWSILILCQISCLLISFIAYKKNIGILEKEDSETKHDINELRSKRTKLLIASYFTGIASGTLGIGGGMILGPFMLALDMEPRISTALSGFTVLFTSSSTTAQFIIAGAVHFEHAWFFMVMSLIGSLGGLYILRTLVKKYNKPSILIWIIFGVLCMAGVVLPLQMGYNLLNSHKGLLTFGKLC